MPFLAFSVSHARARVSVEAVAEGVLVCAPSSRNAPRVSLTHVGLSAIVSGKFYYALDVTHPEALQHVVDTVRHTNKRWAV